MDETMNVETVDETIETEATDFVEDEGGFGLGGVLVGAGATALAVGGAAIFKNRDKIKGFFAKKKDAAKIKAVNAHLDALEAMGYEVILNEKETEE